MTELARAVAGTGDHQHAEALARSITNPAWQARALTELARAVAGTGDHQHAATLATDAETIARSLTDPDGQALSLTELAGVVGQVHSRALIAAAMTVGRWTVSLQALAEIDSIALAAFLEDWTSLGVTHDQRQALDG